MLKRFSTSRQKCWPMESRGRSFTYCQVWTSAQDWQTLYRIDFISYSNAAPKVLHNSEVLKLLREREAGQERARAQSAPRDSRNNNSKISELTFIFHPFPTLRYMPWWQTHGHTDTGQSELSNKSITSKKCFYFVWLFFLPRINFTGDKKSDLSKSETLKLIQELDKSRQPNTEQGLLRHFWNNIAIKNWILCQIHLFQIPLKAGRRRALTSKVTVSKCWRKH